MLNLWCFNFPERKVFCLWEDGMKEFIITNVSIIDPHNNLNRVKKEIRVCNGK